MDKRYALKQFFLGLLFSNSHSLKIRQSNSSLLHCKNIQIIFSSPLVTLPPSRKRISNSERSRARIWPIMGHRGSITIQAWAEITQQESRSLSFPLFSEIKVDVASSGYVLIRWSWSVCTETAFHKCWRCELSRKERVDYPFGDFWRIVEELKRRIVNEID